MSEHERSWASVRFRVSPPLSQSERAPLKNERSHSFWIWKIIGFILSLGAQQSQKHVIVRTNTRARLSSEDFYHVSLSLAMNARLYDARFFFFFLFRLSLSSFMWRNKIWTKSTVSLLFGRPSVDWMVAVVGWKIIGRWFMSGRDWERANGAKEPDVKEFLLLYKRVFEVRLLFVCWKCLLLASRMNRKI